MNKCKNSSEMDLINMHESKLLKEKQINVKIIKITTKEKEKECVLPLFGCTWM